jgi:hypothetical protein
MQIREGQTVICPDCPSCDKTDGCRARAHNGRLRRAAIECTGRTGNSRCFQKSGSTGLYVYRGTEIAGKPEELTAPVTGASGLISRDCPYIHGIPHTIL